MRYPDTTTIDNPPLLEPDNYIIKLDEIKESDKKGEFYRDKNGRQYVLLMWAVKGHDQRLIDGIYPDADPNVAEDFGRLLRIKEIVDALGGEPKGGELNDFVGKVCRASVIIDTYKGKEKNKITRYEALESGSEGFSDNPKDDDLPF